jgi:hypothetical protein
MPPLRERVEDQIAKRFYSICWRSRRRRCRTSNFRRFTGSRGALNTLANFNAEGALPGEGIIEYEDPGYEGIATAFVEWVLTGQGDDLAGGRRVTLPATYLLRESSNVLAAIYEELESRGYDDYATSREASSGYYLTSEEDKELQRIEAESGD